VLQLPGSGAKVSFFVKQPGATARQIQDVVGIAAQVAPQTLMQARSRSASSRLAIETTPDANGKWPSLVI
jgi:hypothetical protein